jgi:predicted dehydrogenase
MSTQPVRVGVVGCGRVMEQYLTHGMARIGTRAQIVAACDVLESKRQYMQEHYGVDNFTTDFEELVQSSDVDLVLVLTSGPTHAAPVRAALEAGKHVLTEKPFATNLQEAAELVALAKRSPGYLVCSPHVILSQTYQTIWQRLQRGEIGKVHSARAMYGQIGINWAPWFFQHGAGSLFDLGVYNVVSLTGYLGPAHRVMAMMGIANPEYIVNGQAVKTEADDNTHVLIDFGQSVFAVVTTGFTIQQYRCPAIELYGSKGTLQMLGDDWAPRGHELWLNELGSWQIFKEKDLGWHWTDGFRHLVECIQQQVRPLVTPEHAYHVLEIMIRAHESSRDGEAKQVESTFAPPVF